MLARVVLIVLTAAAAVADGYGAHGVAFVLVLGAVVAAATQALAGYWELVEEPEGHDPDPVARLQSILSAVVVALLVVSAAIRSPSLLTGVPALGAFALAGALAIEALQCALFVGGELRRRTTRRARPGVPAAR